MRIIKFRGINIKTNKFVYGNYIEKIKPTEVHPIFWACFIQDMAISMYEVHRKTVGQFTGLMDKNLNPIYQGDIINYGNYDLCEIRKDDVLRPINFEVKWEDSSCSWVANGRLVIENLLTSKKLIYPFEIIGNIHENKDLLK